LCNFNNFNISVLQQTQHQSSLKKVQKNRNM
jgi:hypothetical protein